MSPVLPTYYIYSTIKLISIRKPNRVVILTWYFKIKHQILLMFKFSCNPHFSIARSTCLFDQVIIQQCTYCEQVGGFIYMCWGNPSSFLSWNALAAVSSKSLLFAFRKKHLLPGFWTWVLLWGSKQGHSNANFSWHWLPYSLWSRSLRCVWEPCYFPGISFTQNTSWAVSNRIGRERES